MATWYGSNGTQYQAQLDVWVISQDLPNNRTLVGWQSRTNKQSGSGYWGSFSANAYVEGNLVMNTGGAYDFRGVSGITWGSGSIYIGHNSDGTKSISASTAISGDSPPAFGSGGASMSGWALPTIPRAPGAPLMTGVSNITVNSVNTNFNTPSDPGGSSITSYTSQVSADPAFGSGVFSTSGMSFVGQQVVTGLSAQTLYYARVRATNSFGDGTWSNVVSFTTAAAGAPHLGVCPAVDGAGFWVLMTQPFAVGSVTNYTIRRTVSGPGAPAPVDVVVAITGAGAYYDALVLAPGQSVSYQLRALVSAVQTGFSASVTLAYDAVVPSRVFPALFDGTNRLSPSSFSNETTAWTGTTNISASQLKGTHPKGWRTFSQGAGSSGAVGVVTQVRGQLGDTGSWDAAAVFSNVQTAPGCRVGTSILLVAEMAEAFPTVTYFGTITVLVDVQTRLAAELEFYTDAAGLLVRVRGNEVVVPANTPTELTVSGVAPSGTAYAAITTVDVAGTSWAAGSVRFVGKAQISASAAYPYFNGATADDPLYVYEWLGGTNASASLRTAIEGGNSLQDPDEDPLPSPPRAPVVDEDTVLTDVVWRRYVISIPAVEIRQWIASTPILSLLTGPVAEREVRIRYWRNPANIAANVWTDSGSDFDAEQIISYIPASSTFTIDGVAERATVLTSAYESLDANHLLYGEGGGPSTWPELDCGMAYILTLDVPVESTPGNISIGLDLVDRY